MPLVIFAVLFTLLPFKLSCVIDIFLLFFFAAILKCPVLLLIKYHYEYSLSCINASFTHVIYSFHTFQFSFNVRSVCYY